MDEAWALTQALTRRGQVRVGARGAENAFPGTARVDGPVPDGPWALYLSDAVRRFWLLAFDLDAVGPVDEDARVLGALLDRVGIDHVVTASGPGGGRHVWVALQIPLPAPRVAELARRLRRQLPSLDVTPLLNPDTGCVRPPGAPHRLGGSSRVVAGDLDVLVHPRTTPDAVDRLLSVLPPAEDPPVDGPGVEAIAADGKGRTRLRGLRRALPASAEHALRTPGRVYAAGLDEGRDRSASAQLWCVLLGAARARWSYREVAALLTAPDTPGLDAVRTYPPARSTGAAPRRAVRPARAAARPVAEQHERLGREWARAVAHAARWCPSIDDGDRGFEDRAAQSVELVATVQARADAAPGRWGLGGGPADRRVLDALCQLQLEAVADRVGIDVRRLALMCGIGRETARTALQRLADDSWISLVTAAEGPHAAVWALTPPPQPTSTPALPDPEAAAPPGTTPPTTAPTTALSTDDEEHARSQVITRPAVAALETRTSWLHRLRSRASETAHDVFTPEGLGHRAGYVWQQLQTPTALPDLAIRTGLHQGQVLHQLHRLERAGLARGTSTRLGWARGPVDRDTAARDLEAMGVLEARAARYALEQLLWRWWQSELEWLRLPTKIKRRRRRLDHPNQRTLALITAPSAGARVGTSSPYPRGSNRFPDHAAAAAIVLDAQVAPSAATATPAASSRSHRTAVGTTTAPPGRPGRATTR